MFDFPQPLGPTTPINWPGISKWVGSTKDLKPESLIDFSCTAYFVGKKEVQKLLLKWEDDSKLEAT